LVQSAAVASAESQAPPLLTAIPAAPSEAADAGAAPSAVDALPRGPGHELDRFYAGLRSLQQHTRKSHVRVAWLGDSHGAADLWSGPLRAALQTRFGDAGPGFVHVGYKAYRHEGMRVEIQGRWAPTPRGPATPLHTADGVFGLGGVLLSGSEDGPRASLTVTDPGLPQTLQWDLCYKPATERDELSVSVTGLPDRTLKSELPLGPLRHVSFTTATASPVLRVLPLGGQPGLCGVTIETDPKTAPGVVLDTLGINGARLATPLAWDEAAWVRELSRRAPSLVIVEYGTNESGDHTIKSEVYVENLRRLLARVHAASPDCDCLVLAPTDRADTEERTPLVRDALHDAARASGCGFWDTYAIMGGKGSITAWHAESPPRSGPDGVHLTPRGYKDLGDKLAADVLAGYRP
jgi:lysophospholipase L1-like esterase